MQRCFTCGNEYDNCFTVIKNNTTYLFDSFECAIHAIAPCCKHCHCKIIGHGVQIANHIFCCANCSRKDGINILNDRI